MSFILIKSELCIMTCDDSLSVECKYLFLFSLSQAKSTNDIKSI